MVSVSMIILTSIVVLGLLIYIISKRRVILDFSQISRYFVFRGPRTAAINAQSQPQLMYLRYFLRLCKRSSFVCVLLYIVHHISICVQFT